jgi:hypothetical protein
MSESDLISEATNWWSLSDRRGWLPIGPELQWVNTAYRGGSCGKWRVRELPARRAGDLEDRPAPIVQQLDHVASSVTRFLQDPEAIPQKQLRRFHSTLAVTLATMSVLARPRAPTCAATLRIARLRHPAYSTSSILLAGPRRSNYFNSGFSSSYDPSQESGRGPIFSNKQSFGVPPFYPRDLKRRVDDYVVGQDRAKKTICSVIFNHYQGLRRRQHHELQDQRLREKLQRQKYAQDQDAFERAGYNSTRIHPVEGGRWPSRRSAFPAGSRRRTNSDFALEDEYPGHNEAVRGAYQIPDSPYDPPADEFYIPEDFPSPEHVRIDKSNLLLIGPTGVGKTYILE